MFEEFRRDPGSVSESWRDFFQGYKPGGANLARPALVGTSGADEDVEPGAGTTAAGPTGAGTAGAGVGEDRQTGNGAGPGTMPEARPATTASPTDMARTSTTAPAPTQVGGPHQPAPGVADMAGHPTSPPGPTPGPGSPVDGTTVPLRGSPARVVANMTSSLTVPTATSFRAVPAKLLEVNRLILNNQLARSGAAGKVSFTHLIGWAVVQAVGSVPALNSSFRDDVNGQGPVSGQVPANGQVNADGLATGAGPVVPGAGNGAAMAGPVASPAVFRPDHVNLGIAVDLQRPDGTRTLMVPVIRQAETLDFRGFWSAYEEMVRKVRTGKAQVTDFVGPTLTLTNPGTLGTVQSVPRLMVGQGAIIGVGAIDYPAEWQGADPRQLAGLGISKVVTITSTYDHRVVQGAESGLFLQRVHGLLLGEDGFYQDVFRSMGIPYEPVKYHRDVSDPFEPVGNFVEKQQKVDRLVNAYRVRGHLIAHLDPLDWSEPRMHAELDPLTYGLTVWDLDREFLVQGLGARDRMRLGDVLSLLRDAYCRTVGVEYMHIMEPAQKRWIQEHVEGATTDLGPDEHRHILSRLNAAEALERFLETKYIGQKRFGLEGAESAIPLLDALLGDAADLGHRHAVMGMAHRGRLNVLINIVGKSYGELFGEFEGNLDPTSVQGSGDVKYHKGFRGNFVSRAGNSLDVALASNPSHLEAVGPLSKGWPGPYRTPWPSWPRTRSRRGQGGHCSHRPSSSCPSSCTATPLLPARAWWRRRSTCRRWLPTRPVAPSTS